MKKLLLTLLFISLFIPTCFGATFYLDYLNGNDANDGSTWALAWKTITTGATLARIAPGDVIRIAKSPDPTSLGITGVWTNSPTTLPVSKGITSSTNASPINVVVGTHGYSTGDVVYIQNHATNLTGNGTWIITVVDANNFTLDGSTGVGVGGATGTTTLVNWLTVKLASALTKTVTRCEQAWTLANASTVTKDTSQYKEGDASARVVKASPANSTLYAYFATGALDLSGYQKISFWIRNATAILANQWDLVLCSDTAGVTVVDTIAIPAIPSVNQWLCLTIARNAGGNLGASIQSVALYSGTSAGSTSGIYLDNIIASTTDGLNLQSLLSKNSAAQGGTEGFYGIQSISEDGKAIRLDNATNTSANVVTSRGQGYTGTTETVTTYKRETIKTDLVAFGTTIVQEVMDSGSLEAGNIQFQGGWNISTTAQDGETFFDGLNGFGYGFYFSSQSYITLNYLNVNRYYTGVCYRESINNTITTLSNANNNSNYGVTCDTDSINNTITTLSNANNNFYGVCFDYSNMNTITTLSNANNNIEYGVWNYHSNMNTITTLSNANNNGWYGVYYDTSNMNTITTLTNANNNIGHGVYYDTSNNNTIKSLSTSGNGTSGIFHDTGINYIRNALIAEATEFTGVTAFENSRVFSEKHDQTANNHYIYTDGGIIRSEGTVRHTASGIAWKLSPTSTDRQLRYPLDLKIAKIACTANNLVTVKAWMRRDNTGITGSLVCKGNQLAGVLNDVSASITAVADTWEELTITFTPTEAGVVEIEAWAYGGTTYNLYVDDMTVTVAGGAATVETMDYSFQAQPFVTDYQTGGGGASFFTMQ